MRSHKDKREHLAMTAAAADARYQAFRVLTLSPLAAELLDGGQEGGRWPAVSAKN